MKNIFYVLSLSLLLTFPFRNYGQDKVNSKIGFEKISHDFGIIKEENGKVIYEFKFTNNTKDSIKISNVQASCGCTTPSWTRATVMPGKSGYVKAQYNPENRPNSFIKSLSVSYTIGNTSNVEVLTIKGFVQPKVKTAVDKYPIKSGAIRFNYDYINLGSITTKEPITREIKIYNDGNKKINFNAVKNQGYINVSITPHILSPKDSGSIKITYDPKAKNDFGTTNDLIELPTSDSLEPVKKIHLIADINMYFPPMSREDSLKSPRLSFDKSTHNFGVIKQGDIVSNNFEITNSGKSELRIFKIVTSCGCTTTEPEKTVLKPGEKTNLKVTFNSAGKSGQDSKSVTIYTNDPTYSEALVVIKADIQTPVQKDTTNNK